MDIDIGNNSKFKNVSLNFSLSKGITFSNTFGTPGYLNPKDVKDLEVTLNCKIN